MALTGQSETFKTSLLGSPFEFQSGSTNGESQVSALRFSQEYVHRTQDQVISALSRMTFGLPILGATVNSGPDQATGEFFSWLGQTQLVRRLNPTNITLLARADLQLANKHLFIIEQMAVGGRYSVRGYREFTVLADNVFLGSLEARIPVYTSAIGEELLYLVPFFDYGRAWNTNVVNRPFSGVVSECGSRSDLEYLAREPLRGVLGPASESPGQSPYQPAGLWCASAVGGRGVLAGC